MSDEIKQLRIQYKLSQMDLARETGISIDTIRKWEQGYTFNPTKKKFIARNTIFNTVLCISCWWCNRYVFYPAVDR